MRVIGLKDGFITPPNHVNFEAKKLFGAVGQIIDGSIAYITLQGNVLEENVPGGVRQIEATQSPIYIVCDADPVPVAQSFMQRVLAFFKQVFRVLVNGFVGR